MKIKKLTMYQINMANKSTRLEAVKTIPKANQDDNMYTNPYPNEKRREVVRGSIAIETVATAVFQIYEGYMEEKDNVYKAEKKFQIEMTKTADRGKTTPIRMLTPNMMLNEWVSPDYEKLYSDFETLYLENNGNNEINDELVFLAYNYFELNKISFIYYHNETSILAICSKGKHILMCCNGMNKPKYDKPSKIWTLLGNWLLLNNKTGVSKETLMEWYNNMVLVHDEREQRRYQ